MSSQSFRLEALIEFCPPLLRGIVAELLSKLRAPRGAEMLRSTLSRVEDILVLLHDEIPGPLIKRQRDGIRSCLKLLRRNPDLSDESFTHPSAFACDPIYKIFAESFASDPWEKRSLRNALLVLLLQESPPSDHEIRTLISAIEHPPVISKIPVEPDSILVQIRLTAKYMEIQSARETSLAGTALVLQRIVQTLSALSPAPEVLAISSDQLAALEESAAEESPTRRQASPSELLKKLTITVATRAGASIRHNHRPLVQLIPSVDEVSRFLGDAKRTSPDLGDWLAIHTLLSTFSNCLLENPAAHVRRLRHEPGNPALVVAAPMLSKKKGALESRPGNETIRSELVLPLPQLVVTRAAKLISSPGYDFAKMKKQSNDFSRRRADRNGLRIKLTALQRLLPLMLGGGNEIDATLLHLLGLREITRRDAGIYYFSPAISELLSRYREAVTKLAALTGQSELLEAGWTDTAPQTGCFGASARPSREALIRLVQFLTHAARLLPGKPTLANRLHAFNAEAARLTVLFLAVTGARPFEDVFPDASLWDGESGEVILSEKDSLLYRSTRRLPITDRLAGGVAKLADRKRAIELEFGKRFDAQLLAFLIDAEGEPLPPTVSNMKALIPGFADHWPWSNDILRHHFRTRLWELGCDASVLEHALGHLGKSQTPDNPLAMRPILASVRPAIPFISRLVDEIGF